MIIQGIIFIAPGFLILEYQLVFYFYSNFSYQFLPKRFYPILSLSNCIYTCIYPLNCFYQNMESEHLLDMSTENIPPSSSSSSPKDQSPASFSRDLIGRLGISSQGTETVIPETQNSKFLAY